MGQAASKQQGPVVFTSPVVVSPQLARTVEELESDYARDQRFAALVEKKLTERLYLTQVETESKLAEALKQVPELDEARIELHNTESVHSELQKLEKQLGGRPQRGQFTKDSNKTRLALAECLERNRERPLVCRPEFEQFEERLHQA